MSHRRALKRIRLLNSGRIAYSMIDILPGTMNCIDAAGDITRTPLDTGMLWGFSAAPRSFGIYRPIPRTMGASSKPSLRDAYLGYMHDAHDLVISSLPVDASQQLLGNPDSSGEVWRWPRRDFTTQNERLEGRHLHDTPAAPIHGCGLQNAAPLIRFRL